MEVNMSHGLTYWDSEKGLMRSINEVSEIQIGWVLEPGAVDWDLIGRTFEVETPFTNPPVKKYTTLPFVPMKHVTQEEGV